MFGSAACSSGAEVVSVGRRSAGSGGEGGQAGMGSKSNAGGAGGEGGSTFILRPTNPVGARDGGISGAAAMGSMGSTGSSEVCDGVDNDGNGIIDDVDAQQDGVCDCLNIATIGEIGPWSNGGNVFKSWLNSRSPIPATELGDKILTDELLKPFQVIVVLYAATMDLYGNNNRKLTAHHAFSDDEVAAFTRWVKAGGGVMTTIGYAGDEAKEAQNVNLLLAPLGMAYSVTKLDLDGPCESWLPHPVTEEVKRIITMNGVQPDGANGMTLAFDSSHRVALQVAQAEAGHVVVWGDEWITYDSEWKAVQDQQVERFWLNILKWLSPTKVCQVPISPS